MILNTLFNYNPLMVLRNVNSGLWYKRYDLTKIWKCEPPFFILCIHLRFNSIRYGRNFPTYSENNNDSSDSNTGFGMWEENLLRSFMGSSHESQMCLVYGVGFSSPRWLRLLTRVLRASVQTFSVNFMVNRLCKPLAAIVSIIMIIHLLMLLTISIVYFLLKLHGNPSI